MTCNNGLSVNSGTVSFVANAIPITAVYGVNTRITTAETNIVKYKMQQVEMQYQELLQLIY